MTSFDLESIGLLALVGVPLFGLMGLLLLLLLLLLLWLKAGEVLGALRRLRDRIDRSQHWP